MVFTLASTRVIFLAFGSSTCVGPMFYTISFAYLNALNSGLSYPVASASVKVLQRLWRNDLAALKVWNSQELALRTTSCEMSSIQSFFDSSFIIYIGQLIEGSLFRLGLHLRK
ncbi:uncharacterized protein LOC131651561 isoform X2 [Vicia villosa]|uniref:uncharacterized protein LOC131651561 isoform X2 n=1 Tax=Vicia villosa TaxID=3911 RepID=UPI00273CAB27|nr:uncharacterized protein LOC131651561 isoform X2 [Vicia villosa]